MAGEEGWTEVGAEVRMVVQREVRGVRVPQAAHGAAHGAVSTAGGEWVVQREVRTHKRLAENLSRLQLLACKEKWRPEHRYGDWVPAKRANLGDDNIKASTPSVGHKHNMPEKQAPHRVSEQNVVVGIPSGQAPHRVDGAGVLERVTYILRAHNSGTDMACQ